LGKEEREGTAERATTFPQNALGFSLKSTSSLTTEELLFLPSGTKICEDNALKEIKTNSL